MKLRVKVKPRSAHSRVRGVDNDGSLLVELQSAPADGAANAELIKLLAQYFSLPKTSIRITSGAAARVKTVQLPDRER